MLELSFAIHNNMSVAYARLRTFYGVVQTDHQINTRAARGCFLHVPFKLVLKQTCIGGDLNLENMTCGGDTSDTNLELLPSPKASGDFHLCVQLYVSKY